MARSQRQNARRHHNPAKRKDRGSANASAKSHPRHGRAQRLVSEVHKNQRRNQSGSIHPKGAKRGVRSLKQLCRKGLHVAPVEKLKANDPCKILVTALPRSAQRPGKTLVGARIVTVPKEGGREIKVLLDGECKARSVHRDSVITENDGRAREKLAEIRNEIENAARGKFVDRTRTASAPLIQQIAETKNSISEDERVKLGKRGVQKIDRKRRFKTAMPYGFQALWRKYVTAAAGTERQARDRLTAVQHEDTAMYVRAGELAKQHRFPIALALSYLSILQRVAQGTNDNSKVQALLAPLAAAMRTAAQATVHRMIDDIAQQIITNDCEIRGDLKTTIEETRNT